MARPMAETFEIERIDETRCARLVLRGELDLYGAPRLDDELVELEGEKWPVLFLDMRELVFIDSAGLRLVMRTHARAQQDGRRMVIIRGGDTITRVFELTGLTQELELVDEPFIPDDV
jgi:anti-sigma B factor antagonist